MIVTLTALNLKNQDMTLLVNTIYKNFLELATEPRLNHNKDIMKRKNIKLKLVFTLTLSK